MSISVILFCFASRVGCLFFPIGEFISTVAPRRVRGRNKARDNLKPNSFRSLPIWREVYY